MSFSLDDHDPNCALRLYPGNPAVRCDCDIGVGEAPVADEASVDVTVPAVEPVASGPSVTLHGPAANAMKRYQRALAVKRKADADAAAALAALNEELTRL